MWFLRAILACVRVIVLFAILGVIGYIVYDKTIADGGSDRKTAESPTTSLLNIGDMVTMNANVVACPLPEDANKVRDLLRTYSDRQPASSYAVGHQCIVLAKSKGYKVEAHSAQHRTECLQVPGKQQCYWTPVDALEIPRR